MEPRSIGRATAWWAVLGVAATFLEAVARLGARGGRAIERGLTPTQWLVLGAATVALVYVEGYRALQRRFVPRVVSSALSLGARGRVAVVLAPLYAVGLVGGERSRRNAAWRGVLAIAVAVLIVRALPEPWRAVVDAAVAAALAWGLVALVAQSVAAMRSPPRPRQQASAAVTKPDELDEVVLRKAS